MLASFFPKVPLPVSAFLLKLGILALGIGWVFWVGWPSLPKQLVSEEPPALPSMGQDLLPETITQVRPASSPAQINPAALSSKNLPASVLQAERAGETFSAKALLNVNGATQEELEQLPGLGAVLAQRIIAYRQANGPFHHVDELERVPGIGRKRLQQIRFLIMMTSEKA